MASFIEEKLGKRLSEFLSSEFDIIPQFEIKTKCGRFFLDFAIKYKNERIGIECDGYYFHSNEYDREYDFWRDALILGSNGAKDIIRITGRQIFLFIDSCLFQICRWYPQLFSKRNLTALESLSLDEFRMENEYRKSLEEKWEQIMRDNEWFEPTVLNEYEYDDIICSRFLTRRCWDNYYYESFKLNWQDCYKYALQHEGLNIREIIDCFKEENLKKE